MRSMRHIFACWLLLLDMDPGWVAQLMGHKSKEMVYKGYDPWRDGVHTDKDQFKAFVGPTFLA